MKEALHIPSIATLSSVDATAIRQITLSLVEAIEGIKKDVEELKKRPIPSKESRYKGNF
jgi:hypothetical protein